MDTDSDVSSPQAKSHGHTGSDHGELDDSLDDMKLNEAGANMGHHQQQDIQKLIEEVTKKEEKWTKEQVSTPNKSVLNLN